MAGTPTLTKAMYLLLEMCVCRHTGAQTWPKVEKYLNWTSLFRYSKNWNWKVLFECCFHVHAGMVSTEADNLREMYLSDLRVGSFRSPRSTVPPSIQCVEVLMLVQKLKSHTGFQVLLALFGTPSFWPSFTGPNTQCGISSKANIH